MALHFSHSVKSKSFYLILHVRKVRAWRTNYLPKVRQLSGKPESKSSPAGLPGNRRFTPWAPSGGGSFPCSWIFIFDFRGKFSAMQLLRSVAWYRKGGLWVGWTADCAEEQTVVWPKGAGTSWPVAAWKVWWGLVLVREELQKEPCDDGRWRLPSQSLCKILISGSLSFPSLKWERLYLLCRALVSGMRWVQCLTHDRCLVSVTCSFYTRAWDWCMCWLHIPDIKRIKLNPLVSVLRVIFFLLELV